MSNQNQKDLNQYPIESVWDYPRPPRLEKTSKEIKIVFNEVEVANTKEAYRVLETSHPPVYYLPPKDVKMEYLTPLAEQSFCEWKGIASYYSLVVNDKKIIKAAWYYPQPTTPFVAIKNYLAFYPAPMDGCYVDGEKVIAQSSNFYGGWITSNIKLT